MLISKISRGSVMDQIYLSKNRKSLKVGSYVTIQEIKSPSIINPYYHNVSYIEPIKYNIIKSIFEFLEAEENVLVTGSFLEEGFSFEDLDLIVFGNVSGIQEFVKSNYGIDVHIIEINSNEFNKGINTDPLFQMIASKFIAKNRIILNINNQINYKLMDLALVKSELILTNYEISSGPEKYKLLRNAFAIKRFIENKQVSKEFIDKDIENYFYNGFINDFQKNIILGKSDE
ncbi:hypothetical protein J4467_02190 [Candidatus Woesearchaeota archaeon]|nr:hypothetical protein [Candidatus Woesearchaeota archaeon]